jgi:hypothetical protein
MHGQKSIKLNNYSQSTSLISLLIKLKFSAKHKPNLCRKDFKCIVQSMEDPGGRSVLGVSLWPLDYRDSGFEYP